MLLPRDPRPLCHRQQEARGGAVAHSARHPGQDSRLWHGADNAD
jgi:hypothetical protein